MTPEERRVYYQAKHEEDLRRLRSHDYQKGKHAVLNVLFGAAIVWTIWMLVFG